jgi:F-type H+-transporting ATPase subunit gamma
MPSLIDIRRRVRAVKSTQQITKAMKMVASSKLRRAQERIVRGRPYAQQMLRVFNSLATRTDSARHVLLQEQAEGRPLLIVITADRGLAGSFNANVIKSAAQWITEQPADRDRAVALALVGRKGRDFFLRRGFDVRYEEVGLFQNVKWAHAQAIASTAIKEFLAPDVGSVYLVYNEFRSIMSQRVVIERLLPIPRLPAEGPEQPGAAEPYIDYLFEPSPEELLDTLLPFHVAVQISRALLESSAAEHAARMTAMDSATRNASDMVERLTLYMNKVRQAAITREIIEIVAGAGSV